jgi:hypothetical protein
MSTFAFLAFSCSDSMILNASTILKATHCTSISRPFKLTTARTTDNKTEIVGLLTYYIILLLSVAVGQILAPAPSVKCDNDLALPIHLVSLTSARHLYTKLDYDSLVMHS